MDRPPRDQQPEAWSHGATGYAELFAPFTGLYVEEVLDLLGVGNGTGLIDVAAGSGALSVAAAGRGATVLAVDFAPGMVEVLRSRFRAGGQARCRAEVMDGQRLDVESDSFDAGASMFGLMFFPDTAAGLGELGRVVRPGRRVAIGTWNLDRFPLIDTVGAGIGAMVPGLERPEPTWAPLGRPAPLADAMRAAGFADVTVRPVLRHWRFTDAGAFFRSLPDWSPPVQPLFDAVPADLIDRGAEAFAAAVAALGDGDGLATEAIVAAGTVV